MRPSPKFLCPRRITTTTTTITVVTTLLSSRSTALGKGRPSIFEPYRARLQNLPRCDIEE
jgi:hypothetical protein